MPALEGRELLLLESILQLLILTSCPVEAVLVTRNSLDRAIPIARHELPTSIPNSCLSKKLAFI